jgi:serine phosphatase RsbU (regulator of sigma subunit)
MEPLKPAPPAAGGGSGSVRKRDLTRSLPELIETVMGRPAPAAAPEAAGPALRIRDASGEQRTVPLDRDEVHLGRQTTNEIQFLESHVSKQHAKIARDGDQYRIVDVGSKAGVFVNGTRTEDQILVDGDVITLGLSPVPTLIFSLAGTDTTISSHSKILTALQTSTGEQSLEKLARFLEFNRLVGNRITLAEILENVVDIAIELTDAERGFLILQEPDGRLDYRLARHRDKRPLPTDEVKVSATIVRDILNTGESRAVKDAFEEKDLADQESVVALNLRSAIALPLKRFAVPDEEGLRAVPLDEVFGVLYLDSQQARARFSRLDRGILETLANNASSAIENGRLYRETEEKRKMDEEFARAREVQEALRPKAFWAENHFDVIGTCVPCLQLGGDYLDQFRLPDAECCVVVADVSGKGMSAALLAAALQGMMAAETSIEQPMGRLVERLNRSIHRLRPEDKFVTFFCGALAPDGTFTFVNAGHPPPLVLSQDGRVRTLSSGAMALGFMEETSYRETRIRLESGDIVLLYSDGVTEAFDSNRAQYGEERLEEILKTIADLPAEEIHGAILEDIGAFCGGQPTTDDVTLMVLKYL